MQGNDDDKVSLLISMGFAESQARKALHLCQGNIDTAIDRILSGHVVDGANTSPPPPSSSFTTITTTMAQAPLTGSRREEEDADIVQAANGMNQYSFSSNGGSSACTCIALQIASTALEYLNHHHHHHRPTLQSDNEVSTKQTSADNDATEIPEARKFFTPERLQSMLLRGIEMYNDVVVKLQYGQDHFSPEQVLAWLDSTTTNSQWNDVSLKLLDCGIRQGLLRNHHDMDLKSNTEPTAMGLGEILHDCHLLFQQQQQQQQASGNGSYDDWMCAIITKPPETVCVFLPPPRTRVDSFQQEMDLSPFILVDSHPRPGLGIEGAYVKFHSSLDSLVSTLMTDIFPFTHLGNDQEENDDWMTAMYNSFDVYPLILFRK